MDFTHCAQSSGHQKARPDSPGAWRFAGSILVPIGAHVQTIDASDAVQIKVMQHGETLVPTDPATGYVFTDAEWIGCWEKQNQ